MKKPLNRIKPEVAIPYSFLQLFFSNPEIMVIEKTLQRSFVWTYKNIQTFWDDFMDVFNSNISSSIDMLGGYSYGLEIGIGKYSDIDDSTFEKVKNKNKTYQSIVDASQRLRLALITLYAYIYTFQKREISLPNGINVNCLKIENDEHKLMEFGNSDLNTFYSFVESEKQKNVRKLDTLIKKLSNQDEEKKYQDVYEIMINLIELSFPEDGMLIESFKMFLNNIIIKIVNIDKEDKFSCFLDDNKKGTPMSDTDMYTAYIMSKFDDKYRYSILTEIDKFKSKAKECQEPTNVSEKTFRKTKNGVNAIEFIMIEALKITIAQKNNNYNLKNVFSSTFNLSNSEYGIQACFEKKIFKSIDDAINYFKLCTEIAIFLIDESRKKHENIFDDYYYYRDFSTDNVIWWYYIKPCFIAHTLFMNNNYKRYIFVKDILFKLRAFYVVYRTSSTNSQNLINLLEEISNLMIKLNQFDDEYFQCSIKEICWKYLTNCNINNLSEIIQNLTYAIENHKNAMEMIYLSYEYNICGIFDKSTDTFYQSWIRRKIKGEDGKNKKRKVFECDHWFPQSKFSENDDKIEYQHLGNILLLEEGLNKSKGNKIEKNSDIYSESGFFHTKFMIDNKKYNLSNEEINKLGFPRFNEENINEPTIIDIKKRTKWFTNFFVDFITKTFIINNEK